MIHRKQEAAPNRLVFVLHKDNSWLNNGGGDFSIPLKPPSALTFLGPGPACHDCQNKHLTCACVLRPYYPGVDDIQSKILTAESTYSHWSLFNRFILALQLVDEADSIGVWVETRTTDIACATLGAAK